MSNPDDEIAALVEALRTDAKHHHAAGFTMVASVERHAVEVLTALARKLTEARGLLERVATDEGYHLGPRLLADIERSLKGTP